MLFSPSFFIFLSVFVVGVVSDEDNNTKREG